MGKLKELYRKYRTRYETGDAPERQRIRLLLFGWLGLILFISFVSLSQQNPIVWMVPGWGHPLNAWDSRVEIEAYYPRQKTNQFIPSRKKILMPDSDRPRYAQSVLKLVFHTLADGPRLKRPGESFQPADDWILNLLPRLRIRSAWVLPDQKLLVDLALKNLREPKPEELREFFQSLKYTLQKNADIREALGVKRLDFRIQGIRKEDALKRWNSDLPLTNRLKQIPVWLETSPDGKIKF